MQIIFAYIKNHLNGEIDIKMKKEWKIHVALELFKTIRLENETSFYTVTRSFLNDINRSTSKQVLSSILKYIYFDGTWVTPFPVSISIP